MSRRYRMQPTLEQAAVMVRHCGDARFVWNLAHEQASCYRRERGPTPNYYEQQRQLAEARAAEPWLRDGSATVQQGAIRDYDRARRDWWAGTHSRPSWRRKGRNEGFVIRDLSVRVLSGRWATVFVPKSGAVRFRLTRPLPIGTRSARVTYDAAGRWHVSFTSIGQSAVARRQTGCAVGVDRGVAVSAASSDGRMESCPRPPARRAERLVRLQRQAARQRVRGRPPSSRLRRTYRAIARLRAREADARKDWVEKTSTTLVREHDVIVFEKLRTANMTRSARGTAERPGRRVRQKAGLNRAIAAAGWGLAARTKQKADASGVLYIEVDPAFTSQTCAACGLVDKRNRKSQAVFACVGCGHSANADTNAAQVILARGLATTAAGLAVAGRGDLRPLGGSVKRQPLRRSVSANEKSRRLYSGGRQPMSDNAPSQPTDIAIGDAS